MSIFRFVYVDESGDPGVSYHYWVELRDADGHTIMNGPVGAAAIGAATVTFAAPAQPNPVTGRALFEYALGADVASGGLVEMSLVIHDLQGRAIRTLRQAREEVGLHRLEWNVCEDRGARVEPGVYYLRFRAGHVSQNLKVAVVR
ncbi:MAG: hypothetical protein HZC42_09385 [Candidatus Eisenbacteria bacterium]|nr:hypothetical protein [Candidatus Eisenbacteria bacterium]